MNLEAQLLDIKKHIQEHRNHLKTEEATKNALVIPFLRALGYDVTNPKHVTPELVADYGSKKGEKVDYGLGEPGNESIILECKKCDISFSSSNKEKYFSQVARYFNIKKSVKFAILTNGINYEFYSDIDDINIMDNMPFYSIDLSITPTNQDIKILTMFHKENYCQPVLSEIASKMLQKARVKDYIYRETLTPSADFSIFIGSKTINNKSRFTQNLKEAYCEIVPEVMSEVMEERLKSAREDAKLEVDPISTQIPQRTIDGYNIIRAMVSVAIEPERIFMRPNQSYCAIILDDNARKTIVRLYFNTEDRLSVGFITDKEENKKQIDSVNNLFNYYETIMVRICELCPEVFMPLKIDFY